MEPVTTLRNSSVEPVLAMAFELGAREWKIAFSDGLGQRPRLRTIPAGELERLAQEIEKAQVKFHCVGCRVVSCYEAGRDGFWLHRALEELGVENHVIDSASIEVNRKQRRAKTDRLDAGKLLTMLQRYLLGDSRVWKRVQAPSVEDEDRRQIHRELGKTRSERLRISNRIKSLLFAQGIRLARIQELPEVLKRARLWNGAALPKGLVMRLKREWEKIRFLTRQIEEIKAYRRQLLKTAKDPATECTRKLMKVRGIGENGAWTLSTEFYAWRRFKNGKQIGALAGLVSTPYQSGNDAKDQGISKAGNPNIRHVAIELAWGWLRYQPQSELSLWFKRRYGEGSSRLRRIGIVAVARKLLIALWRYLENEELPAGAILKKA